jgi:hypothetical protein
MKQSKFGCTSKQGSCAYQCGNECSRYASSSCEMAKTYPRDYILENSTGKWLVMKKVYPLNLKARNFLRHSTPQNKKFWGWS